MSPCEPRVLVLTSAVGAVGGIPNYMRGLVAALDEVSDCTVTELHLTGSAVQRVRELLRATAALVQHRPDLLVLGHVGLGPVGLLWRLLGGRYVVLAYGIEIWGPPSRRLELTLRRARAVWPISSWTRTEVLRVAPRAHPALVLGGNVGPEHFQDHETVEGPFRILFVATLDDLRYKGVDTLVTAAQQLATKHPIEIRIAGRGAASAELAQHLLEHDPAGVVRTLGRLAPAELEREYRQADVAVLVSRFRRGPDPMGEGLGLVPLEAGAAGTPAIVGAEGGGIDTVLDGRTGYVVPAGRPDVLAEALARLIDDPELARRMGESAREHVRAEHSLEAFGARVRTALAEAVS